MPGDGERAALRPGLRERDEETCEEDAVSPREAAIESVDRLRGGRVPCVQQVQAFRRESALNLNTRDRSTRGDVERLIRFAIE